MNKKQIIVVLGMHRGGTSAIARGLKALGVDLGSNLMPPGPDNETGFWEDMDIYALNEQILAELDEAWSSVRLYDGLAAEIRRLGDIASQGRALLDGKLKAFRNYGFKDPRTSRLLPFWRQIFAELGVEPRYVIATRNPLSVAQSLLKRDGISAERSHLLWMEHMLSALYWTQGSKRVVVDYDWLMKHPDRQLRRIRKALQLPRLKGTGKLLSDYSEHFLTESLRHTRFDSSSLTQARGMPPCGLRLYRLLIKLASDRISPENVACVREVRRLWNAVHDLSPVFSLAEQGVRDTAKLNELNGRYY